jgi:hypothetical protein
VALAESLGVPQSEVDAAVARIDKNGDRALCFAFQNKVQGGPNIIDDVARSRSSGPGGVPAAPAGTRRP